MEHVHHLPWVGKNYSQDINGNRVMGLGESRSAAFATNYWNEVIREFLNR